MDGSRRGALYNGIRALPAEAVRGYGLIPTFEKLNFVTGAFGSSESPALRSTTADTTRAADRRLDQPAVEEGDRTSVIDRRWCLTRLDRFRRAGSSAFG